MESIPTRGSDAATISLDGVFDAARAWELRRVLEASPGRRVVLDFSRVREFFDFGVAVLAHGLAGRPDVELRGLRTHQARLFGYFGVAVTEAGREAPRAS